MDNVRYTPRRFAELLDLTSTELEKLERGPLKPLRGGPVPAASTASVRKGAATGDGRLYFTPKDLAAARATLGISIPQQPLRRQLFLNFKGGTGKTSVSTAYAFRLAEMGHKVLVVDLDSQGHASKCLGVASEDLPTLTDALIQRRPLAEITVSTCVPGLDLVPSNLSMSTVDLALMPLAAREFRLRNVLKEAEGRYAFVVMDAPPSFGLLNLNALMAASDLFVPVLADFLSFHGLKLLFETVQSMEEDLQHVLDHIFIVMNAYNQTYKIAREARVAYEKHYPEFLLKSAIRQCTKFAQASSEGIPIFGFDWESKGAQDIQAVMDEVFARTAASAEAKSATVPLRPVMARGR